MVRNRASQALPSNLNELVLHVTELPLSATDLTITALFPGRVILLPFLACDAMRLCDHNSLCLSVCHTRGLCPHGSTYDHDFFTM